MTAKKFSLGLASIAVFGLVAAAIAQGTAPAPAAHPAPAAKPPAVAHPAVPAPSAASAAAPVSAPAALLVATADGATTMPAAAKAPEQHDLEELMEALKGAHRGSADPNPEVALRAAKEVERLSIAGTHPSIRIPKDEYTKLLAALYWSNQDLQKALAAKAPQEEVLKAYQAQNASCNACHKIYRKKKG